MFLLNSFNSPNNNILRDKCFKEKQINFDIARWNERNFFFFLNIISSNRKISPPRDETKGTKEKRRNSSRAVITNPDYFRSALMSRYPLRLWSTVAGLATISVYLRITSGPDTTRSGLLSSGSSKETHSFPRWWMNRRLESVWKFRRRHGGVQVLQLNGKPSTALMDGN